MNKIVRWKPSLGLVLVALLLVPASFAKMRHDAALAFAVEEGSELAGSSVTQLPDGRLLVVGGQDGNGQLQGTLSTREPLTGTGHCTWGLTALPARCTYLPLRLRRARSWLEAA